MGSCFWPIFGGCHQGSIASTKPVFNPVLLIASTGPVFNPVLGLRLGPTHLLFQTSSFDPLAFD